MSKTSIHSGPDLRLIQEQLEDIRNHQAQLEERLEIVLDRINRANKSVETVANELLEATAELSRKIEKICAEVYDGFKIRDSRDIDESRGIGEMLVEESPEEVSPEEVSPEEVQFVMPGNDPQKVKINHKPNPIQNAHRHIRGNYLSIN